MSRLLHRWPAGGDGDGKPAAVELIVNTWTKAVNRNKRLKSHQPTSWDVSQLSFIMKE